MYIEKCMMIANIRYWRHDRPHLTHRAWDEAAPGAMTAVAAAAVVPDTGNACQCTALADGSTSSSAAAAATAAESVAC